MASTSIARMTSSELLLGQNFPDQTGDISAVGPLCRECKNTFQPEQPVKSDGPIGLSVPFHSRPWKLLEKNEIEHSCLFCGFFVALARTRLQRFNWGPDGPPSPWFSIRPQRLEGRGEINIRIQPHELFPHQFVTLAMLSAEGSLVKDPQWCIGSDC